MALYLFRHGEDETHVEADHFVEATVLWWRQQQTKQNYSAIPSITWLGPGPVIRFADKPPAAPAAHRSGRARSEQPTTAQIRISLDVLGQHYEASEDDFIGVTDAAIPTEDRLADWVRAHVALAQVLWYGQQDQQQVRPDPLEKAD